MARKKTKDVAALSESQFKMEPVTPRTKTQKAVFDLYSQGKNLFLHGSAGTGKTYIAVALALKDILSGQNQQKLIIVRAPKAVADMGFLPGDEKDKMANFEAPIKSIVDRLVEAHNAYNQLKGLHYIEFMSTAFVRGNTWDNAIVIVDESASANFHELDSVITRLGENSRIIFCGDFRQSDLDHRDKGGFRDFMKIMHNMPEMEFVEFTPDDIVRSKFVKSYIITKEKFLI